MHAHCFYLIVLISTCFVNTLAPVSFDSVRSFFGGTPHKEVIEKDYSTLKNVQINIKNYHGAIDIKPGLDKKSIALRATKHASAAEHLDHMHVIEEEINTNTITLRTTYDYEKVKGYIDYELTVPDDANVHISTEMGTIKVQQLHGSIQASVHHGDITIIQPQGVTQASITQQGNIVITQPTQETRATTNKGTIYVKDSTASVIGKCQQGKVEVKAKMLPEKSTIDLANGQGNICLYIPTKSNCSLHADAPKGSITSQQAIRIDAQSTILNSAYWQRVKHHVTGSIGTPDATVRLYAQQGNVRLFEH